MPENDPGPPTGPPPRILKLEYQGNVYNWFDLNQTEAARHDDFIDILRQNIVNYYQVPHEYQLLFDNDGLLIEPADVRRAVLYPEKPFLKLVDLRELVAEENGIGSGYGSGQVQALLRSDVEKMLNGYAADVEQLRALLNRGTKAAGRQGAVEKPSKAELIPGAGIAGEEIGGSSGSSRKLPRGPVLTQKPAGSLLRHTAQLPAVPRIALHQDGVAGPDFPLPGIFGEARIPQTGFGSQVTSKDVLAVRRAFELAGTYRRLRKTEARLQKQLLVPPAGVLRQSIQESLDQTRDEVAVLADRITSLVENVEGGGGGGGVNMVATSAATTSFVPATVGAAPTPSASSEKAKPSLEAKLSAVLATVPHEPWAMESDMKQIVVDILRRGESAESGATGLPEGGKKLGLKPGLFQALPSTFPTPGTGVAAGTPGEQGLAIQPVTPSWPQWRGGAILASGITAAPRRTLSGAKEEDTVEQQENYLYNPNPIPTSSQQDQKASTLVVDPLAASAGLEGGGSGPATRGGTRPQRPATLRSPNVLRNSPLSTRYGGGGISSGPGPLVLLETGGVDNADFFYPRIAAPGQQQGGFLSGAKQRGLSPGSVSSGGALSRSRQSKPIELPGSDGEVTTGNANEEGDQHLPGRVFTVTLTRNNDPTRKFGLVNVPYASDRLLVKFVDQYGLLHESNMKALRERTALRQIPDVVEVGDVILAVNDHKSVFGMRAELQNANSVNLLVQKTTTPSRSPSAEVLQRGASFLQTGGGSSRAAVLKSASKTSLSYVPGINMGGRGSGLSPGRGQQVEAEVTAAGASTRSFVPGILKAREGRSLSPSRDWELQRSPGENPNSDAALRARIRELEAALETRRAGKKGAGTVSGMNYSTADRLLQTPNFAVGGGTAIPGGGAAVLTGEQLYDLDGAAGAIFTGGDPSSAQVRAGAGAQPHTVFLQPGQEVTILKSPTATSPGEQLVLRAPGFEGARNLMDPFGRKNTISRTDQNPVVAAASPTAAAIGASQTAQSQVTLTSAGPAAAPIFVPADESADFVDDAADHEQIPSVPLAATNSYAAVAKKSVQEKSPVQNPDQVNSGTTTSPPGDKERDSTSSSTPAAAASATRRSSRRSSRSGGPAVVGAGAEVEGGATASDGKTRRASEDAKEKTQLPAETGPPSKQLVKRVSGSGRASVSSSAGGLGMGTGMAAGGSTGSTATTTAAAAPDDGSAPSTSTSRRKSSSGPGAPRSSKASVDRAEAEESPGRVEQKLGLQYYPEKPLVTRRSTSPSEARVASFTRRSQKQFEGEFFAEAFSFQPTVSSPLPMKRSPPQVSRASQGQADLKAAANIIKSSVSAGSRTSSRKTGTQWNSRSPSPSPKRTPSVTLAETTSTYGAEKRARSGSSPKRVSYRDNGVYTATDVADPVDLALEKECWKLEPGALGSERITRLKPMIYKLADRKFFCNLVNSSLHVRVGGTTYVPFAEWALGLNRGADDSNSSFEMPNPYAVVG